VRRAAALLLLLTAGPACSSLLGVSWGGAFVDVVGGDAGDAADVVTVDQVDAAGDVVGHDAAPEAEPDAGGDVEPLGDADASDAGDGFDGCVTTPAGWCSGMGVSVPCGAGSWSCEAGLCNLGVCSLGAQCADNGGGGGNVSTCAP
jgi:hypothetical protein